MSRAALLVIVLAGCTVRHVHEVRPTVIRCSTSIVTGEVLCRMYPARGKR